MDLETNRIPMFVKVAFTAFMTVLVPVYWINYGPANFLYFCDVALFLTLAAVWLESPLLVSIATVGIVAPQIVWLADFAVQFAGLEITGMTDYMFDSGKSLFLRGLSLFHGWLPLLLIYLVYHTGYDRRAFVYWTALAWILLLVSYLFLPGPRPDAGDAAVNINYVHGMSDTAAQTWMHPLAWLGLLMLAMPLLLSLPAHIVLRRAVPPAAGSTDDFDPTTSGPAWA